MLELWRAPRDSGEAIGCLATTYTFEPALFDEQCLARFLDIDSEPNKEGLAFLIERERQLHRRYAGVLVDHTQAGVHHSLRWDVLPVCIRGGKQHAKVSLLAWSDRIRIIVASANLTGPGYRRNQEVAAALDLTPDDADREMLAGIVAFLRGLISFVQGAPKVVARTLSFVDDVENQAAKWRASGRSVVRHRLACTLPGVKAGNEARSALSEAIQVCRGRGGSPTQASIASPFFDADDESAKVVAELCKMMARGATRTVSFSVPCVRQDEAPDRPRLAAPRALMTVPPKYGAQAVIKLLPEKDADNNGRPWHAKMLALSNHAYSSVMTGSSNFTCAGMGVGARRNAEANLVTIADYERHGRDTGLIDAVWPKAAPVENPEAAEWLEMRVDPEDDEHAAGAVVPAGFLSASYRAGNAPAILLDFDPACLPVDWTVCACGRQDSELLTASTWKSAARPATYTCAWAHSDPPERLLVRWGDCEAFLPLNVEDGAELPEPPQLRHMTAEQMLQILAATDPSAATRWWVRQQEDSGDDDQDLDTATTPIDLDPLRRNPIQSTFLHRIRRRARVLSQLRTNLERPVWGRQGLEWRLRGLIGVEALGERFLSECEKATNCVDEALLTLADFLIVLREVDYKPTDLSLPKPEFDAVFHAFLREQVAKLDQRVSQLPAQASPDVRAFWGRVVERCAK
jgi:hypothetical protein